MEILKNNWDSQLQYVVSLFNTSCNTNIIKNKLKIIFDIYKKNRNNINFLINYKIFFSPSTLMSKTKVQKIPKIQIEHL